MKGTSQELQEVVIACLMSDAILLSKAISIINDNFFSSEECRTIYRSLKKFYNENNKIPSQTEVILYVDKILTPEEDGLRDNIKLYLDRINSIDVASEDYAYKSIADFIRKCNSEQVLNRLVENVKSNREINYDSLNEMLQDAMFFDFARIQPFNLSDVSKLIDVRKEAIGDEGSPKIARFFIKALNGCLQYGGITPGTVNMICAPPGRGKTTFLINQGVYSAVEGLKVLHIFLGDMSNYDGWIRYLSCFTGVPSSKLVEMSPDEQKEFVKKSNMSGCLSNINVISYAADQMTAIALIEEIKNFQKQLNVHYDVIIVDYDENILNNEDNMYKSGGQVYNKLAYLAVLNKSVVFVASQPKTDYWKQEIITLEGAAESSRKQKIVDMMLTISKPMKDASVATLYIAKNRRGVDSKVFRMRFDGNTARFEHITEDEYETIKAKESFNKNRKSSDKQ